MGGVKNGGRTGAKSKIGRLMGPSLETPSLYAISP